PPTEVYTLSLHDALPISSMTYSGSLLALIEVVPRTRSARLPPGSLLSTTSTPATLLSISCWGVTTRPVLNSADETCVTAPVMLRSEEHTSELQSPCNLVC